MSPHDSDVHRTGQAIYTESVLTQTAGGSGVGPGAVRLLLALWLVTHQGRRGVTTRALWAVALGHPPRLGAYLATLTQAGHTRRTRATRTDAPLVYLTDSGAQVVRGHLLALERANGLFMQKLRENL